jgi:hypothetical protein
VVIIGCTPPFKEARLMEPGQDEGVASTDVVYEFPQVEGVSS